LPDDDEATAEEWQHAVLAADNSPGALIAAMNESKRRHTTSQGRGPQKAPTKVSITIRLERETVAAYRASGRGWQTRLSQDVTACARRIVPRSRVSPRRRQATK
jgi:uncharacterized protein (DUF4415 family)